jgi:hypothetical protein
MLSNYPPGVSDNTPDAPWNEPEIPEKEFNVLCSQTLSKSTPIWTDDYWPGASGVDYEPDGEGGYCASGWQEDDDTSNTDWHKVYKDNTYTPLEIISKCGDLCKFLLDRDMTQYGKNSLKLLMEACQGWQEDETEIMEDK